MKVVPRKYESQQTFSSTGFESFQMTPSTSAQNKHDLLNLLRKLNVNQKYIDIQLANNYKYDEIQRLNEDEFAQKFQVENNEEFDELSTIFMRLKSEALPESCEMQRDISVSNSVNDDENNDNFEDSEKDRNGRYQEQEQERPQITRNPQRNLSNFSQYKNSHISAYNFGNYDTHSQYQFGPYSHQSIALPQSVLNLSQTLFYNVKQLPYNPLDFNTSTYISQSSSITPIKEKLQVSSTSKINPGQVLNAAQQIKQVVDTIHRINPKNIDDSAVKQNIQRQHIYLRVSQRDTPDKYIPSFNQIVYQGQQIKIGRHSTSDIVLVSDQISRTHALLEAKEGRYFIKDPGSGSGTFVMLRKDEKYQVLPSSIFMCGVTEFKVTKMILEEDAAQLSLQIISGNKKNTKFDFNIKVVQQKTSLIGSNAQCDVSAVDIFMERFHASLVIKKGQVLLMDLQSKAGTWIRLSSQKKESEELELQDGQTILIHPYLITGFIHNI